VSSDAGHVERLYNLLTGRGLRVWWDKKCLKPGVPWEDGFCDGLVSSRAFVCFISRGGIAHPTNARQSFSRLTQASACDNVLLEHQLALELRHMGLVDFVFPVFLGDNSAAAGAGAGSTVLDPFDFSVLGNMPDISVASVLDKVKSHMDRQCLGDPLFSTRTVKETVSQISSFQGGFLQGDAHSATESIANTIQIMLGAAAAGTVNAIPAASLTASSTAVADLIADLYSKASAIKQPGPLPQDLEDQLKALKEALLFREQGIIPLPPVPPP
jgi:hypothetical protein